MADTLFEIGEQFIENKGTIFSEPDFQDIILQNRDRINHCECYKDVPTSFFKIILNRIDSDKIIATFANEAGYNTAITTLKG